MAEVKTDVQAKAPEIAESNPTDLVTSQEQDLEVVDQADVFDAVIAAANKLEAYAKAQDTILNIIIKRSFAGDWVCHDKKETPETERKANLGAAGAERIATFLGVQEANWKEYPKEWSEDHKHYSYAYSADFTFRGITRHAVGRAGTRDKFFSAGKAMEDINEDDIRVAAFRECFKKGITRLFGLRHIPLTKLTALGYDTSLVKLVEYESRGKQLAPADLKNRDDKGIVSKKVQVAKLEKFEGINKNTNKPWTRFDLWDKEGIKYAVFAPGDSKRIQTLAQRQDDQKEVEIRFKAIEFRGQQSYQVEWIEGGE